MGVLRPLERDAHRLRNDVYHQPLRERRVKAKAIDPSINLATCITTNGGTNAHFSGTRSYTCRELASLQGIPPTFNFSGTPTQAKKQCGNAWPTKSNTIYFTDWAAHKEAFEAGWIGAEDEVLDLYAFLEDKGFTVPRPQAIDIEGLSDDGFLDHRTGAAEPEWRYLTRITKTVKPLRPLKLWAKRKELNRVLARREVRRAGRAFESVGSRFASIARHADTQARFVNSRRRRDRDWIEDEEGHVVITD
ncbi:hypothetical protein NX059_012359 [Plenodomus lindquistii]|nr:hypothetical protein NX059_012145 [Plenodomus lindquistii]KAI8930751.1 hypothetical protein NX059_012359 [Plenodomus lindquistii]